jgi:hypothetical protein
MSTMQERRDGIAVLLETVGHEYRTPAERAQAVEQVLDGGDTAVLELTNRFITQMGAAA